MNNDPKVTAELSRVVGVLSNSMTVGAVMASARKLKTISLIRDEAKESLKDLQLMADVALERGDIEDAKALLEVAKCFDYCVRQINVMIQQRLKT
jgi:hypothetical protein